MTWEYWICLYTRTHCAARGLRASTIGAYQKTLEQFREYIRLQQGDVEPGLVTARHVLEYVNHLRQDRHNGDSAVNRQVTVLKNFYRAIVAMCCELAPRAPHTASHVGYANHTTPETVRPCIDRPCRITIGTTALLKLEFRGSSGDTVPNY